MYASDENFYLITVDKIHLKCDVVDDGVVNSLKQPILFRFILGKPSGYMIFCELETILCKENKKSCFEYYNILFRR